MFRRLKLQPYEKKFLPLTKSEKIKTSCKFYRNGKWWKYPFFLSCFLWKYFVALWKKKVAVFFLFFFLPPPPLWKTQWNCLAKNAAMARNLHLRTCLFLVVLYFERILFLLLKKNITGQKNLHGKNLDFVGVQFMFKFSFASSVAPSVNLLLCYCVTLSLSSVFSHT